MALSYSTGLKDGLLDTGDLKTLFENGSPGGYIKVYEGAIPADADAALAAAVLLTTYSDADQGIGAGFGLDLAAAAVSGAIAKLASQVWSGTAVATGTAAFWRYEQSGDTGNSSASELRMQGTVGGAGADLFVQSTAFASGTLYTLDFFSVAIPL